MVLTNSVPELVAFNGAPLGEPKPPLSTLVMAMMRSLFRCACDESWCGGEDVVDAGRADCNGVLGDSDGGNCVAVVVVLNSRNSGKPCFGKARCALLRGHTDKLYGSMQHVVLGPAVSGAQGPKRSSILITVEELEIARSRGARASDVSRPSPTDVEKVMSQVGPLPGPHGRLRHMWSDGQSHGALDSGLPLSQP